MKILNSYPTPSSSSKPKPTSRVIPKVKSSQTQALSRAPAMTDAAPPVKLNYFGFKIPKLNAHDPSKDMAGYKRPPQTSGGMWTTKRIDPGSISSASLPPPPLLPPRSPLFQGIPTVPPFPVTDPASPTPTGIENITFYSSLSKQAGQQQNYNKKRNIKDKMDNDSRAQAKIAEDSKNCLDKKADERQQRDQILRKHSKQKENVRSRLQPQVDKMLEKEGNWNNDTRMSWDETPILKEKQKGDAARSKDYNIPFQVDKRNKKFSQKVEELNEAKKEKKLTKNKKYNLKLQYNNQKTSFDGKAKVLLSDLDKTKAQKNNCVQRNDEVEAELMVPKRKQRSAEKRAANYLEEIQMIREELDFTTTRCQNLEKLRVSMEERLINCEAKIWDLELDMGEGGKIPNLKEKNALAKQLEITRNLFQQVVKRCEEVEGKRIDLKRMMIDKEAEFKPKFEKGNCRYQTIMPHEKKSVQAVKKEGKKEKKKEKKGEATFAFFVDDEVRDAAKYLKAEYFPKKAKQVEVTATMTSSCMEEDEEEEQEVLVEEPRKEIPWAEDENAELPDID
ncbi:unnamed protein product [Orchesella dallaii]|uniref:Uncharacterized protein n=1 Tax=Orchesella dallaii TaxID=48710 RepID=A0ABP1S7T3_9HEXA